MDSWTCYLGQRSDSNILGSEHITTAMVRSYEMAMGNLLPGGFTMGPDHLLPTLSTCCGFVVPCCEDGGNLSSNMSETNIPTRAAAQTPSESLSRVWGDKAALYRQ